MKSISKEMLIKAMSKNHSLVRNSFYLCLCIALVFSISHFNNFSTSALIINLVLVLSMYSIHVKNQTFLNNVYKFIQNSNLTDNDLRFHGSLIVSNITFSLSLIIPNMIVLILNIINMLYGMKL